MLVACSSCREEKEVSEFHKNRSATGRFKEHGISNMCKPCHGASRKRYYEKNKRKVTSAALVRAYGIDIDTFEAMRFLQDNLCKLCGEPESVKDRELAVDHDHTTGEVRGLLCFKCNTALGRVADDVESAKKVLAYLTGESCQ